MGFFSGAKNVFTRVIDVRVDRWMSYSLLKETSSSTMDLAKGIVTKDEAKRRESFEEALVRLNLTEQDIQDRRKEFYRLMIVFTLVGLSIIAYAIYMAVNNYLAAAGISLCLSLYAFSQAFKFHFWLFQIQNRKLGCTLREWFNSKIITDETPKERDQ